jgi:hypothetical protein
LVHLIFLHENKIAHAPPGQQQQWWRETSAHERRARPLARPCG